MKREGLQYLLLLQPTSSQLSFCYSMMHHIDRSGFSHGQYGIVEFLLDSFHARNGILIYRNDHMPASPGLMPIDHHDRRCPAEFTPRTI
jgi:hypothetical protein